MIGYNYKMLTCSSLILLLLYNVFICCTGCVTHYCKSWYFINLPIESQNALTCLMECSIRIWSGIIHNKIFGLYTWYTCYETNKEVKAMQCANAYCHNVVIPTVPLYCHCPVTSYCTVTQVYIIQLLHVIKFPLPLWCHRVGYPDTKLIFPSHITQHN